MPVAAVTRCGHRVFRKDRVLAISGLSNHFLIFLTRITPRRFQ
jgi:DNA-directed RNA polymerase subunit RPC12/RpoP